MLLKYCNGSTSIFFMNGLNYIFYRQMIISALIGAFIISLRWEYDRWYTLEWEDNIRLYGLLLVCYSMNMIFITYAFFKYIFLNQSNLHKSFLNQPASSSTVNVELVQNILLFLSSLGFIYIWYYSPSWPMLDVFRGNHADALKGRISFRNDFRGSDFIKNLIAFSSASLYFYISLSKSLINKKISMHLFLSIFLVFIIYTYNSQKGGVLNVLIGGVIIYCMVRGRIPLKKFIVLTFILIAMIIFLFSIVKGIPIDVLLDTGYKLIVGRLFLGNVEGLFNSIQLFPNIIIEDTSRVGIPSVIQSAFWGDVQEPSKLLLMKYFDMDGVNNGTSGFITSYFLAEAWANYGFSGLLLAPVFVAINLFIVDYTVYKKGKNPITLTFYAMMYLQFQLHGEFVGFLYMKYFLYLVVSITPVLFVYIVLKKASE